MEHNSYEQWHRAEAAREAAREVDRIDTFDTVLVGYEKYIAAQTDTSERIRDLLALTKFYYFEFGVHFEKRHAYRNQLYRVLTGDLDTVGDAQQEARVQYAASHGLGLPRLQGLASSVESLPENGIIV